MDIKGSIVALVTPMKADGSIDFAAFKKLLYWHCEQETDGIVVLGSTGEAATVTEAERVQLIEIAVKEAAGRAPIIVGTGSNSTRHTIELTRQAKILGAAA